MTEGTMRKVIGPGERAERDGRQRFVRLFLLLTFAAFMVGVFGRLGRLPDGSLVPAVALALGVGCPILFVIGTWRLLVISDEREVRHNIVAAVVAACFYGIVYPSWLFLWMGRLAPEPSHQVLFVATAVAAFIGYIVPKLRGS